MNLYTKDTKKKKYGLFWRMMLIVIIGLVLFTFQSAPDSFLTIKGVAPNMLIPFVIAVAVFFGGNTGAFFGLFAGLLLDLYTTSMLPLNAILVMVFGCACGLITRHFMTKNLFSALLLCILVLISYYTICWLVYQVAMTSSGRVWYYLHRSIPGMVYSAVFMIPWYFIVKLISRQK